MEIPSGQCNQLQELPDYEKDNSTILEVEKSDRLQTVVLNFVKWFFPQFFSMKQIRNWQQIMNVWFRRGANPNFQITSFWLCRFLEVILVL